MTDFGAKARSAVIWNAGFNVFRDSVQFGVMIVLVRLLAPAAYGQFSFVSSVLGFLAIFSFSNFIAHTVQVKSDEDANFQEHFTAGAVLQTGMFLATNVIAFGFRWWPAYAPVAPLLHVMSITFLLEWPCEVRRKMFERQFNWRSLRLLHGVGLLMNGALAIVMALCGAGTYALLVPGLMVTLPFIYDLFVRRRWRPTWVWSWDAYKPAWKFGVARIGSGLTLSGRHLLESGVLSFVLGFAALGVLNRSMGLAQIFCYKIATQLVYAIYPILTRVDSGVDSQRVGGLVLRVVAWTVLPTAVCLGVLARPVVEMVYGAKWRPVIPLLPWTLAWGAIAAVVYSSYMLLLSRHRQHQCLIADILILIGTALSLWWALPHGLVIYVASLVGIQAAIATLLIFWLGQCKAISLRGVAEALIPPASGVTVGWLGTVALFNMGLRIAPVGWVSSLGWGAVFLLGYLMALRIGFGRQLSILLHYFPARDWMRRLFLLPLEA